MNFNKNVLVTFYGDTGLRGYEVSYLLIERRIHHTFVPTDGDFILSLHLIRDILGYYKIVRYLREYEFIADLWI